MSVSSGTYMIAQQEQSKDDKGASSPSTNTTRVLKKRKNQNVNTDHSVVIIGWGHDEKSGSYWVVRNSFGKEWGQQGDFQVAMGQNDFGIEAEVSAYEPRLCDTSVSKNECVTTEPRFL